ncbi:MAG: hypothetical protein ACI33P_00315 [Lysinibacillus sp.]
MNYVLGIVLGTSAVKVCLMNGQGTLIDEATSTYSLYHEKAGYFTGRKEGTLMK